MSNVIENEIFPYNRKEAVDFTNRMSGALKVMNYTGFADMNIIPPEIDFFQDNNQFYDGNKRLIHIGIYGILDLFHPEDEADYMSALNYVYGHEQQHCRSTASRPYGIAIQKGCEAVLEYIQSQVEPFKRKFRKESDYEDFANNVLPSLDIYISWNTVHEIVAGLANSLEDGRIERIRSNRWHGFDVLRKVYRGRFWNDTEEEYKEYSAIDTSEKLRIICNQILSLATCQLYTKGFISAFANTPLVDEVNAFMPYIGAGVMAGKTRGLIKPVVEISKLLAPYIYEVCKISKEDIEAQRQLQELLSDMISSMLDKAPDNTNLSEKDEDIDDGSPNSTFSHSDLIIEVDDEIFDKLEKNSNDNGDSGLMIKRKNPKEEEKEEEKKSDNNPSSLSQTSSNSKNKEEDKDSSPKNEQSDSSEKNDNFSDMETSENSNSLSSKEAEEHSDNSLANEETGEKEREENQSDEKPSSLKRDFAESQSENNLKKNKAQKHVGKDVMDEAAKVVAEAMKKAAAETRAEAEVNISTVNASIASAKRAPETVDTSKPVSREEMKDICDFQELKREYKIKDRLPAVLAQRGKTLRRKNEQYFKSLSKPDISYLDSGSIDPSLIYSLGIGNTDIFRKEGKPYKSEHCAYMLVDNSGSMYGNKRTEACKASAVIEEGFKGLLPLKIVAFDECGCVIHEVIKNWDESLNNNMSWNFCLHGRNGGGNEDGYDIAIATRELMKRPERKKLLLVLSDGTPGDTAYCHDAIAEARRQGIEVIGIYFEEGDCASNPQFERMYEKDYICCSMTEIDSHLERIFKKFSRS